VVDPADGVDGAAVLRPWNPTGAFECRASVEHSPNRVLPFNSINKSVKSFNENELLSNRISG